ncbi:MAG: hypothetical protein AAGG09_07830 [Pseudomonadota bacterium]
MSDTAIFPGAGRTSSTHLARTVAIALVGAALYAALLARSVALTPGAFGVDIYDQMWLAFTQGQLDLPARVLRMEGHYTPDGTAYSYHGVAPLITRALFDPFVTMGTLTLAPISLWIWATLGTAFYHAALLTALGPEAGTARLRVTLALTLWFVGPGVILTANHAFYHEPIALAYAATGAFVLLWARAVRAGRLSTPTLVGMAALAALTVHARPHIAVGLYACTGLALLWAVYRDRLRALPAVLAAGLLLGAGGASYLALNEARFGSATAVHGSFDASDIQYGIAFWELEEPGNVRQQGFTEHGRFNLGRVLPNAAFYLAAPPQFLLPGLSDRAADLHGAVTGPRVGFIRIEAPRTGMVFIWAPWVLLAVAGLAALRTAGRPYAGLLLGLGGSALLLLSYATITLRYLVDLWPIFAALALVACARAAQQPPHRQTMRLGGLAMLCGLAVTANVVLVYPKLLRTYDTTGFAEWSAQECRERAIDRGLPQERLSYICRDPLIERTGG